ncbi:zinc-binding alcohol dehydrogenase family protein [Alkalibacter mobilis]|uniref:zinc-binding alcohol dehydrogenase family protein n=1 Tax=Alkalibacter mobilis TaxID=2787712 RepID=UPI00189DDB4A|nr:zinc-binding alcohol dehydrogenase family protein [Alkalibacter mobilis]MBF7097303.1 zinc-binding alcohol dehydrogenase family protein [Alkalibacter mobilis]
MKAFYIVEPFKLEMREIDKPKLKSSEDVLVQVMRGGICGSDMHNYHGVSSGIAYPLIAGHEMAGKVVEVGENAKDFAPGDHVIMNPVIACGECYPCSIGRENVCENLKARGAHHDGCFSEFIVINRNRLHKISKEISWDIAALVEPFTIAGHSTSLANVHEGDVVYIAGAGPIGICIAMVCKMLGATVIISDLVQERLDLAKIQGADFIVNSNMNSVEQVLMDNDLHGITVAIDAAGVPEIFVSFFDLVLPAGRIVSLGFSDKPVPFKQVQITKKELSIFGSRLSANQFPRVIEWFEKGLIDPRPLISNIFDFDDAAKAIEEVDKNPSTNCKVLLKFKD